MKKSVLYRAENLHGLRPDGRRTARAHMGGSVLHRTENLYGLR